MNVMTLLKQEDCADKPVSKDTHLLRGHNPVPSACLRQRGAETLTTGSECALAAATLCWELSTPRSATAGRRISASSGIWTGFAPYLFLLVLTFLTLLTSVANAQIEVPGSDTPSAQNDAEISASLNAITSILVAQDAKRQIAGELRKAIENAGTEVDRAELSERLKTVNLELVRLENQIVSLATGFTENELNPADASFELQDEVEELIRPFIWTLKSATENAREIEQLKQTILATSEATDQAEKAIERVKPMIERAPADSILRERLELILQDWETRLILARDQSITVEQQLRSRLDQKVDPSDVASQAFTSFFSDRGRNFFIGLFAFVLVIFVSRLMRRVLLTLIGRSRNRSFPVRLGTLIYDALTLCLAFGTTIAIFNFYNDWFLTGAMLLAFLTIGWFLLKSLPSLIEQVTLLLNLGAVQEGERVVINNVPWRVSRLDLYSELENPSLRGGHYTVPVRELRGQHSRPMDGNEKWFPSEEGDWVLLDNGLWAEVILQSPEAVHLREEGGAVSHFTTPAYLDQNPKNLSDRYRATIEFGIDYAHQADAATQIPERMQAYIDGALRAKFGEKGILSTYVTLFRAGASSLDFEIEADVGPGMGHVYETVEHALARFAIECCTQNGWTIPFQQLVVHRSADGS
ncbi:hypothetical protein IWQ54_002124 [Labrenzia sp. EL_195]|nr:hypothetical protein [Labrenzia sp. EL_195]